MPEKYVAVHQLAAVLHKHKIIISNIAVVESKLQQTTWTTGNYITQVINSLQYMLRQTKVSWTPLVS